MPCWIILCLSMLIALVCDLQTCLSVLIACDLQTYLTCLSMLIALVCDLQIISGEECSSPDGKCWRNVPRCEQVPQLPEKSLKTAATERSIPSEEGQFCVPPGFFKANWQQSTNFVEAIELKMLLSTQQLHCVFIQMIMPASLDATKLMRC